MRALPLLPLVALLAAPLAADVVYLKNGSAFEDVVAELGPAEVRIRLSYGEIALPLSSVERVEKSDSGLAEYLRRRQELRLEPEAGGAAWLALARWALTHDLDHGVREAALVAARLEPGLEGLAPLLRQLGYVFDEELGAWLAYDDLMRNRGYVLADGGRWISRDEQLERQAQLDRERDRERERRQEARADRTAELAELILLREVARGQEATPPVVIAQNPYAGLIYSVPAPIRGIYRPHGGAPIDPRLVYTFQANNEAFPSLLLRQPGSLLPVGPPRSNQGSFERP